MEYSEFIPNSGYRLIQDDTHFRLGTDSILLAAFASYKKNMRICDLGCGGGALMILAAGRAPTAKIDGLEILPSAVELAQRNITLNQLNDRLTVTPGDIGNVKGILPANGYDLVISNPPYFSSGPVSSSAEIASARSESSCTLKELCAAASLLLKSGGKVAIVYRCERLAELISELKSVNLEPKRLRFVSYNSKKPPKVFMIEAMLDAKPGLTVEAPLFISDDNGNTSDEVKKIYGMD
ncbi:MAG: tRNA1(Val) (adenine(37)-N6)-methyltransferase [Ruminococcaceae bacterium]|nr:tRNA1(Val) (adenine(37)-N6)-methyltransferase [Oscillospiraceae bacterium]